MDAEPAVGDELDSFSLFLPLPFRLSLLIVGGVWLWGLNWHLLQRKGIDLAWLVAYGPRPSNAHATHHHSTYRFATFLTLPLLASIAWFWFVTYGSSEKVVAWSIIPNLYLLLLLLLFVVPAQPLPRQGRRWFGRTLLRVSRGDLARDVNDGKFGDVLLADALTSYAKPLSEIYVTLCMMVTGQHTTARPDRHCGGAYMVPLIMSIPFLIRFRQCWIDRQPANAVKYLTAFPAIWLSMVQRRAEEEHRGALFGWWIFAVLVNSLYSFYWDVVRDWDLSLFTSDRRHPDYPYGLRDRRTFSPNVYYGVIGIDFILRCTWSLKLSVHLEHFNDIEGGIFLLEALEIVRRWMWVFFRVEAEQIRRDMVGDVLLDGIGVKVDED